MKRQILNIVTFLRGAEPRYPSDLLKPLKKQIKLLEKNNLPATFLFQYDALLRKDFIREIKKHDHYELGVWMEMNKPHVEAAGLSWTGRFSWDWHAHCAMTVGYTEKEREKLVDVIFEKFRSVFGYYPRVLGAWAFDAYTLKYAAEKYGMDAFCNCKDQWGTDGYNMWGGYYGQAYYPSVNNAFTPAGSEETAIGVPVFRMLGSDPILQYDYKLDPKEGIKKQGVVTLEPAYTKDGGGGDEKWVDWYMKENFSGKCLTFGYAQAGQENSFSWKKTKRGLKYQYPLFARLRAEGKIDVETIGETGKWFQKTFSQTPPSTIVAEGDWQGNDKNSYWYDCKNYRFDLYAENGVFRIRDLYLFRDDYKERYLGSVCKTNDLIYDNLPVVDGVRFTGEGILAGAYFTDGDRVLTCKKIDYKEDGENVVLTAKDTLIGDIVLTCTPTHIEIESAGVTVRPHFASVAKSIISASVCDKKVSLTYNDYTYSISANVPFGDDFSLTGDKIVIDLVP